MMDDIPIAWMRRWAFEGEKPYKETNPQTGRKVWAKKFQWHEVTKIKVLEDDVPLYAKERAP